MRFIGCNKWADFANTRYTKLLFIYLLNVKQVVICPECNLWANVKQHCRNCSFPSVVLSFATGKWAIKSFLLFSSLPLCIQTHFAVPETAVSQSVSGLESLQAVVECQQPEPDLYRYENQTQSLPLCPAAQYI